jgi:predicted PurR-regulated permease PerM
LPASFEFVPLVGPLTIAILAALLGLLHSGWGAALMVLVFLGVLRVSAGLPDLSTHHRNWIHLHPLAVIFAILAGAEIAGVRRNFSRDSRDRNSHRDLSPLASSIAAAKPSPK